MAVVQCHTATFFHASVLRMTHDDYRSRRALRPERFRFTVFAWNRSTRLHNIEQYFDSNNIPCMTFDNLLVGLIDNRTRTILYAINLKEVLIHYVIKHANTTRMCTVMFYFIYLGLIGKRIPPTSNMCQIVSPLFNLLSLVLR